MCVENSAGEHIQTVEQAHWWRAKLLTTAPVSCMHAAARVYILGSIHKGLTIAQGHSVMLQQ